MDNDVKQWLKYMRTSKRKRNDTDDNLIKELTFNSIDSLLDIIKQNNINNKNIDTFLTGMKIIYIDTKKIIDKDTDLKKNKELLLLLNACLSISVNIINNIFNAKRKNNKLNIIKYLNEYKKEFNIPKKQRTLDKIEFIYDNIDDLLNSPDDDPDYEPDDFIDDMDDDDMDDEDMDDMDDMDDNPKLNTFMTELKKISNIGSSSKEEIINYFNLMDETLKKDTLDKLTEISDTSYSNIPYLFRILQCPLDNNTKKILMSKILQSSTSMFDSGKNKKWLDDVMKLPFGIYKGIELDNIKDKPNKIKKFLTQLENKMNNAVYGHDEAKKQIVQIMAQTIRNPSCKGNIIGIYGPPGNGKSSLIKEGIANAMNKPFVFISLGGAVDSSFLDGHSFTYEGSIYGRIAQALIDSKCMNPIIYFDELDKVSRCPRGDEIINLLIHLVDPVQNNLFRDKYFYDINLDLSKVTFIFSFNDPSEVNYILRDRITMIETKYLSTEQKQYIGTNYLLPEIYKDMGINKDDIEIPTDIITQIINDYTNEGGVRRLKENLYRIVRELNHANLTKHKIGNESIKFPIIFTNEMFNSLFKHIPKYIHLTVHKNDGIGMVNGLWANSLGMGGVLPIESALIPTKELMAVKATGSLGDVIKESIEVALSVAWNKLDNNLKLEWMEKWKTNPECFHIHCPDGSTGKEGPSAGTAMALAFYSRLTNRKVRHYIAMTGEINLREEVTEIGGLDEKLNAAKRGGAKIALIPYNNRIDLDNIIKNNPNLIDDTFKVYCVDKFDKVIEYSLL